jgi:cytochrome c
MQTMKTVLLMLAACVAAPAHADKKLADEKTCTACHGMDQKVVGPGFKEIATKYAGQADAAAMLADRIKKGGVGNWGQIPMPANNVTDDEAKKLAGWVLSLK